MYKVNEEKQTKLEHYREVLRRQREAIELREAVFKPDLTKTKRKNS